MNTKTKSASQNSVNNFKFLKCLYSNVDSLPNKMHELQICVQEYSPHIILLTEVKQKFTRDPLAESVIRLEGYELFHNLDFDEGRGICIFIRSD